MNGLDKAVAALSILALVTACSNRIPPPNDLGRAIALADQDAHGFLYVCRAADTTRIPAPPSRQSRMEMPIPTPGRAFDNLYFVGSHWTNAWAITTSDGIILLDAMDNDEGAERIIANGLIELGLDPTEIRYIIVSHGHSDHYGGAGYLQRISGAQVAMSTIDWDMMEAQEPPPAHTDRGAPPERGIALNDGDVITLGDTSVEIYLTPGHTMGTISPVFNARSGNNRHRAILWGGSSFNFGAAHPENLAAYEQTAREAAQKIRDEDISVLLSNHPIYDRSIEKLESLKNGVEGNPFVLGQSEVADAIEVVGACARATAKAWYR